MEPIQLNDVQVIADNDHGYTFLVGRVGERWIGGARGEVSAAEDMLFIFPEIADGYEMGVTDRDRAVLLTGAIAQDPEAGYGGVARWYVPVGLRGEPERFRCQSCGRVGCDGDLCRDVYDDDEDLP